MSATHKTTTKASATAEVAQDWSKYETVPFAVLIHSSVTGWIEAARPEKNPFQRYEAFDCKRKMLLNFGLIVAEKR